MAKFEVEDKVKVAESSDSPYKGRQGTIQRQFEDMSGTNYVVLFEPWPEDLSIVNHFSENELERA